MLAESEVNVVAGFQADSVQQLTRDRYLPDPCDLVWPIRHGHVNDLINFNRLLVGPHTLGQTRVGGVSLRRES